MQEATVSNRDVFEYTLPRKFLDKKQLSSQRGKKKVVRSNTDFNTIVEVNSEIDS